MDQPDADNRYLLRVWRAQDEDQAWRATLRDVRDGNLRTFTDLNELVEYLKAPPHESGEAEPA